MSKGKRITCGEALALATPVLEILGPEARIAGSLRRGKETVRDVDVIFPGEISKGTRQRLAALGEVLVEGDHKIRLKLHEGLQVDIVLCVPEEMGACLLYLTGPFEFNIKMRSHAKGMGLKLNEKGLWSGDNCIASKTEKEIFDALGLLYLTAPGRENIDTLKMKGGDEVVWKLTVASSRKGQKPYKVTLKKSGQWHCECKGWMWSKKSPKTCRHIEKVARPRYEETECTNTPQS